MYQEFRSPREKYLFNLRSGRRDFAHGSLKPFTGYSEKVGLGFALRHFYSPADEQLLRDRLVDPIKALAAQTEVAIYPLELWKIHTSSFSMTYVPGRTPGSFEEVAEKIYSDPRIEEISEKVVGTEISLDYVWPGTTITVAASEIPSEVLEARKDLKRITEEMGMEADDYSNIYHISLARVASSKGDWRSFGSGLMRLHYDVYHNPLTLTVSGANVVGNTRFSQEHEAHLLDAVSNYQRIAKS